MKISKQGVLGAAMLVGGSIMLFAITQQPQPTDKAENTQTEAQVQAREEVNLVEVGDENSELSKDIEAEKKIAEGEQQEREDDAKAQEEKSQEFINKQEKSDEQATDKSNQESETKKSEVTAKSKLEEKVETAPKAEETKVAKKVVEQPTSKTETKATVAKKAPVQKVKKSVQKTAGSYQVKSGDSLLRIAKDHGVSLSVLAEANNMHSSDNLMAGQKLVIPSQAQVAKLQKVVKRKQAERATKIKAKKQQAQRKAEQAKPAKKTTAKPQANNTAGAKGTFGVQITLASNQEEANKVVAKLRKAGYKAKTSKTDKGIRVIVGPKRGKKEALALKDKINKDSRVKVNDAWVLVWR